MQCEASKIFTKDDLIYDLRYVNFFNKIRNDIDHILNEHLQGNLIANAVYNSMFSANQKINKINSLLEGFFYDSELRTLQDKYAKVLAKFIRFLSGLNVIIHYNEAIFDAMDVSSLYVMGTTNYSNERSYYLKVQDRFYEQTGLYVECDEAYTEEVNFLGLLTERQWKCYHNRYFLFCDLNFSVRNLTTESLRRQVHEVMKKNANNLEAYKEAWFFPEWSEQDENVFNEIKAKQLLKSLT